jgi:Reverse transcriptase (RNA-dependent DNA polymerase).
VAPIALSNSLYRAVARWIYSILVTIITPLITAWQFGGLKGRTTASSTFQLLEHVAETPGPKSLGMVDFFHAFDSPPKRLLIRALALAGTPQVLLLMILSVYVWAQTKIRGSDEEAFGTTKGVKQGCPMSCIIFVLFINAILIYLIDLGLKFVAYVDDISLVITKGNEQRVLASCSRRLHYTICNLTC